MGVQVTLKDIQSGFLSASTHTANNTLIESALDKALDRTGTVNNAMAIDLDMGNNRIINLANGVANQEAATVGQVNALLEGGELSTSQPINEVATLGDGQTVVTFILTTTNASFHLCGDNADNGRLCEGDDYTVDSTTQITLTQSYPAGTKLVLSKNDTTSETAISVPRVRVFETVAAMKAASLEVGETVETQGYYAAGDGGGATYLIVASQTVDGFGDHQLSNGNVALIQTDSIANVKQFGAVGDGATDDLIPIQKAGEYVGIAGGTVFFPASTYRVTGQINTDAREFAGDNRNTTTIEIDDSGLDVNTAVFSGRLGQIRDLTIKGTSNNATGYRVKNPAGSFIGWMTLKNVNFFDLGRALWFDSVFTFSYVNGRIERCVDAIYVDSVDTVPTDDGYVTDSLFENIFINANTGYALFFKPDLKSTTWTFTNCAFQSVSTAVDYPVDVDSNADPINFINCYFEGTGGAVAFSRIQGTVNFLGGFENTDKGVDLATGTVDMLVQGVKCSSTSAGFFGGSSNTNIVFINHVQSTSVPAGSYVRLISSRFAGVRYDDRVLGTQAALDYATSTEILMSSGTKIPANTNPIIRSDSSKSGLDITGTPTDVFTVTLDSSTNRNIGLVVNYSIFCRSGGVQRQTIMGSLLISAINVSGTWAVTTDDRFAKAVAVGTLSDPTWSTSTASNTLTVSLALTSNLEDATVNYGMSSYAGSTPDNLTIVAL